MYFDSSAALLGRRVNDVNGTLVGHVEDLLIDNTAGRIAYVHCRLTEDFGAGGTLTVPWSAVRIGRDGREAVRIVVEEAALRRLATADRARQESAK